MFEPFVIKAILLVGLAAVVAALAWRQARFRRKVRLRENPANDYAVRQDWSGNHGKLNYSSFVYFDADRDGRYGLGDRISKTEDTRIYLERSFYLAIASGERPSFRTFRRLLARHWREQPPSRARLAMTAFFMLAMLLPVRRAQQGLAYRLGAAERSPAGLLKAVMR